ncbi:MAG: hypothetical protein RIR55_1459 [Bacteroidota bacterium]|jgi:hypothetical protein
MKELDAFEKYLREQLKGQQEPHELMWKRVRDVVGQQKAWYAKSLFKYALTALTAASIGVGSSALYFKSKSINDSDQGVKIENPIKGTQLSQLSQAKNQASASSSISTDSNSSQTNETTVPSVAAWQNTVSSLANNPTALENFVGANNVIDSESNLFTEGIVEIVDPISYEIDLNESALKQLVPKKINTRSLQLVKQPVLSSKTNAFSIQLASNASKNNLLAPAYVLNNSAFYDQNLTVKNALSAQLQYHFPKGWVVGIGIAPQGIQLYENFYQTNVYSYDDKEHYWFNYIFGQRRVSDEELEDGPWPFGGSFPPPFGSDTSHVHTNYTSVLDLKTVQFPLSFGYERKIGPLDIQLTTGVQLNLLTQARQTLILQGYLPNTTDISNNLTRLSFKQFQNIRFTYWANPHFGVYLQPSYALQLKDYRASNGNGFGMNQWQLSTGISLKLK